MGLFPRANYCQNASGNKAAIGNSLHNCSSNCFSPCTLKLACPCSVSYPPSCPPLSSPANSLIRCYSCLSFHTFGVLPSTHRFRLKLSAQANRVKEPSSCLCPLSPTIAIVPQIGAFNGDSMLIVASVGIWAAFARFR